MDAKLGRALAAAIAFALAAPASTAATTRGERPGGTYGPRGPGIRSNQRSRSAVAPAYTIHNVGYPSGLTFSTPGGFNNTGQIFGLVMVPTDPGNYVADCRLWTGSTFTRLPLPATATCDALAINDAAAGSGEYELVGATNEVFSFGKRAFATLAGPGGFVKTTVYYANAPSLMVGVNASQVSLALAAFDRDRLGDYDGLLYFTTTGVRPALATLQTPTAANAPPIHNLLPVEPNATYPAPCVFGGCWINAANKVLGFDALTMSATGDATLTEYTVGSASSLRHLPLSGSSNDNAPIAFNDRDQLVYFDSTVDEPVVFDTDTGTRTILPVLPAGCASYAQGQPLSLNDRGEVLGVNEGCTAPYAYWTWDPVRGTQYLAAQIPASADTIYPLGVNDNGQILIQLVDASGVDYWGTLDPTSAPATRPRVK